MKRGRKRRLPWRYDHPDNNDANGEEIAVYEDCVRCGNTSLFHQFDPQWVLDEKETAELRENPALWDELGDDEKAGLQMCFCLQQNLTEEQWLILSLRADKETFTAIAKAVGKSERAVYYAWNTILDVAAKCHKDVLGQSSSE
ncbi:MAG: hypothetical protein JNM70_01200 [Anaerolineae bacterium]|nr:hypothetical protein [Anaerolineae bacterium]